jgi:hypothetical protein
LIPGLLVLLSFFSCKEKNEEPILFLSPPDLYIPAEVSEVTVIEVTGESPFNLKKFQVISRIAGEYAITIVDSIITGKKFYKQFEYLVPEVPENTDIVLEFILIDETGSQISNFRIISVTVTSSYLQETSGHVMFSGHSGKQNCYDLINGSPQYLQLAEQSEIQIADTSGTDDLQMLWISPSGAEFVRFNGFDYANCTNITSRDAYNAGLKLGFIPSVAKGDIYITMVKIQFLKSIYPVIRVTDVIDEPGSENDRYVFSIKK